MSATVRSPIPCHRDLLLILITALIALLLSPITAVWTGIAGAILLVASWVGRSKWKLAGTFRLIGAGLLAGSAPYFLLAAMVSTITRN